MTALEILKQYLKVNCFDGLCGENCGCGTDDLIPCAMNDKDISECMPAYYNNCPDCNFLAACGAEDKEYGLYRTEKCFKSKDKEAILTGYVQGK